MHFDKAAILVKKAALEFDRISNPIFAEYGLTASQYKILKLLFAQPEKTARVVDLERIYSVTHPTAISLLDQLQKKDFIRRIPNPNDARGKLIALTEKAEHLEGELNRLGEEVETRLTKNLTEPERQNLVRLLNKLLNLEEPEFSLNWNSRDT